MTGINTLYLDTETTGMWLCNQEIGHRDQPLPCQLGALLEDERGEVRSSHGCIIRQDQWPDRARMVIEPGALRVHGISDELCERFGESPDMVVHKLRHLASLADRTVCHNTDFDLKIVAQMCSALRVPNIQFKEVRCSMKESADIVKIPAPGRGEWKWPKLGEAYFHFTKAKLNNAHDALVDAYGCRKVWHGVLRHRAAHPEPQSAQHNGGVS